MRPALCLLLLATAAALPAMESSATGPRGGTTSETTTGSWHKADTGAAGSSTTDRTWTTANGTTGGLTTDRSTTVTKTDSGADLTHTVTHTGDNGASATRTGNWQAQRSGDGTVQVDGSVERHNSGGRQRHHH